MSGAEALPPENPNAIGNSYTNSQEAIIQTANLVFFACESLIKELAISEGMLSYSQGDGTYALPSLHLGSDFRVYSQAWTYDSEGGLIHDDSLQITYYHSDATTGARTDVELTYEKGYPTSVAISPYATSVNEQAPPSIFLSILAGMIADNTELGQEESPPNDGSIERAVESIETFAHGTEYVSLFEQMSNAVDQLLRDNPLPGVTETDDNEAIWHQNQSAGATEATTCKIEATRDAAEYFGSIGETVNSTVGNLWAATL